MVIWPSTVPLWTNITRMFGEGVWLHEKESNFPHFPDFCPSPAACVATTKKSLRWWRSSADFTWPTARRWWYWPCLCLKTTLVVVSGHKKWGKDMPLTFDLRIYALMITSLVYICVDVWLSGKVQYISGYVVGKASRRYRSLGIYFRWGSKIHPWKPTWHWKIPMFNNKYIFKWWMFHCHVSFRGGRFWRGVYQLGPKKQRKAKQLRPRSTPGRKNTEHSFSRKCNVSG